MIGQKYRNCKRLVKNIDTTSDWLNMFTKASERLYLSFVFKMPRTRIQQDRHNERRRKTKSEGRKAIFCMDYIRIKYPEIHSEACEFFTVINAKYPEKRDLKKTHEFQCFKQSPELMKNTVSTENTMSMELEPLLEIPLMANPNSNTTVSTSVEQETLYTTEQIISTCTTQTIETTTEEEIPLTSINDTESDMIDQIIEQLRQDPNLSSVFDDIELQVEFDQLGEDLDIPELNLLEQETRW